VNGDDPENRSAYDADAGRPRTGELTSDEKTMAMACHLLSFAGYAVPFGNIIGPVVLWSMKKEGSSFIDYHGKECVNFQISVTIYAIICIPLLFLIIGFVLLPALGIFDLVCTIIAAVKANNGEYYRYPLSIRFLK
jgi:hypothetical protein